MSDALRVDELTPTGGTLTGLLFENLSTGYPLTLSWTFAIDFAEVARGYGSTTPNIVVGWIPATREAVWRRMAGQRFSCSTFGAPIETSVYFFEHHRYDRVEITVTEQRGTELGIHMNASGDVDSLGMPEIVVDATVAFGGIYVQTDMTGTDIDLAAELLGQFTDIGDLRPRTGGHNVRFEPAS